MHTRSPEVSPIAITAQAKIDDIKRHPLLRFTVFALSIAAVYFIFRLAYQGFLLLPAAGADAHSKTGPILDVLKTLRSGLSN